MNVILSLVFELVFSDVTIRHFSHGNTETTPWPTELTNVIRISKSNHSLVYFEIFGAKWFILSLTWISLPYQNSPQLLSLERTSSQNLRSMQTDSLYLWFFRINMVVFTSIVKNVDLRAVKNTNARNSLIVHAKLELKQFLISLVIYASSNFKLLSYNEGVLVPDRVLTMGQIERNSVLMLNWIVWNRIVYIDKNWSGIKSPTMVDMS